METDTPFEPTILGAMWRYRWVVAAVVVAVVGLAVLYGLTRPVQHQAVATIVVRDPTSQSLFDLGQAQRPERYVANQATIIESTLVLERAADDVEQQGLGASVDSDLLSLAPRWRSLW